MSVLLYFCDKHDTHYSFALSGRSTLETGSVWTRMDAYGCESGRVWKRMGAYGRDLVSQF